MSEAANVTPTPRAELPEIPGCELTGEVKYGGMGAVYFGEDGALRRPVAIKVLREEFIDEPEMIARFVGEAQVCAQLQHPGIVPVHQVGRLADGRPFYVMKLVKGDTLADLLKRRSSPSADLIVFLGHFRQVCEAMAYAHAKGVLHRDLKPANVMVGAYGEVLLMDWGLTKMIGATEAAVEPPSRRISLQDTGVERGPTEVGAVLGTFAYMPPEQACGRVPEVDARSDVFGLGAILFTILTGQPPYVGPNEMFVLRQAMHGDLADAEVRLAQCGADAELQALVRKCLASRREDRPTDGGVVAREIADYLARLEKRLHQAEVQAAEEQKRRRVERQKRRMTLGLAAALLLGTGVSLYFAIDASQQADKARDNAIDASRQADKARDNEADAKKSEADAIAARNKLAETAEELEVALARSWLRPLAVQGGDNPMSDFEWVALWELATNRHRGRLGYRFVEEASRTSVTSRQLRDRAALALSAAIGLDTQRRDEIEALLMARLDDPALGDSQKTDLALAASALEGLSRSAALRTGRQLTQAMKDAKDPDALRALAAGLSAVASRMDPTDAATTSAQAAAILVQAMKDTEGPSALYGLAKGLSAVASRMDPTDAAPLLLQAIKDTRSSYALNGLAEGLSAVASRMDPKDAATTSAQAATILVQAMKDTENSSALYELAAGLSAVASRMDPTDAAQAAPLLLQAMKDTKNPYALRALAAGLSAVASRMDPTDAATTSAQAAPILVQAMKDTKNVSALRVLAEGLSAVASRMDPTEAATFLLQAIKDTKNPYALRALAEGLSAVASRMDPKDAATTSAQAAPLLLQAIKDTRSSYALNELAEGLSAVASRMDPTDAATTSAQAAPILLQAMKDTKDPSALRVLAEGLSAVLSAAPADRSSRCTTAASAVASLAGTGHPLTALAILIPAAEPLPCRLSTQQLVELLKVPPCVGEARRVILDQLGNRYKRQFADVWEFVRFAQEEHLGLDFTSPPQRPEWPAAPPS